MGESGLSASLAIRDAVAPRAPLRIANLFRAGMVCLVGASSLSSEDEMEDEEERRRGGRGEGRGEERGGGRRAPVTGLPFFGGLVKLQRSTHG
jgi:hypothetical protein